VISADRGDIRLLLTGGGTGGHLFPAVATAEELQNRHPGSEVLFVGTRRKVDSGTLAAYGFPCETISSYGLKGKNPRELARALLALPVGYWQALRIIRRFRPDLVFAVGGYVTGPVAAAARSRGVPLVIHEQNAIPGLANRLLGRLARRVCLSLPGSGAAFNPQKTVLTGNPVRREILALGQHHAARPGNRRKTVLVLGGSQGAHAVNRLAGEALKSIAGGGGEDLQVIHQTGESDMAAVAKHYADCAVKARVEPFFRDMAEIYRQADLLVSRAGATTLAEAAVAGIPALLIPYPFAADNHQEKNAAHYVAGGGARQFREAELTPELLAENIAGLFADPAALAAMARAMARLAIPDAAQRIVTCCLEVMETTR
jgi:UDP-N-acetylglucosamine--N-acetylmuramyl-(pentapeptide) pyrophosphoryl-undecaprenol N-acetylglucosamine transferase